MALLKEGLGVGFVIEVSSPPRRGCSRSFGADRGHVGGRYKRVEGDRVGASCQEP